MRSEDRPIPGKLYRLTGGSGANAISNGVSWAAAEVTAAERATENVAAEPKASTDRYGITYGSRYKRDLDVKDIAKILRKELRDDVRFGGLPRGKYSVKIQRFSGGQSVDVKVSGLGFHVHNRERLIFSLENPHSCPPNVDFYNARARELLKHLEGRLGAFNFDGSETQTDYFHVNFYGHVSFDHDWDSIDRGAMLLELLREPGALTDAARGAANRFLEHLEKWHDVEAIRARVDLPDPGGPCRGCPPSCIDGDPSEGVTS